MIAKSLTYELSVRYYEAVIVIEDKYYVPCHVPKKISVAGSAGSHGEDPEEGDLDGAFGDTPFTYLYNVPWGAFYINRPEEKRREGKTKDVWQDMIVSWPPF